MRPITALRADGVPVGELSRLTGVNIETIRYYEKIKMLPPPRAPRAVIGSMGRKKRAYSSSSAAVGS
jgi:MerR family transcriptional regulator, mercuric resistance operon regulatory protein